MSYRRSCVALLSTLAFVLAAGGTGAAAEPSPLAGAWQGVTANSEMWITLFIAPDGAIQAELLDFGELGEPDYEFIADGIDHWWDPYGDEPIRLRMTPHKALLEQATGRVVVEEHTIFINTYNKTYEMPDSAEGLLVDPDTLVLDFLQFGEATLTRPGVAPNTAPYFNSAAVTGLLQPGQPGTVDLVCTAADLDGTVASVAADLAPLGGATVSLVPDTDGSWKALGVPVSPQSYGRVQVRFTAADSSGATGPGMASIMVGQASQDMLEGNWEEGGAATVVLDAAGNAVAWYLMDDGDYAKIPCDGQPHPTFFGDYSIAAHQFLVDSQGNITVSEFVMENDGYPMTVSGTGWLVDETTLSVTLHYVQDDFVDVNTFLLRKVPLPPDQRFFIRDVRLEGSVTAGVPSSLTVSCIAQAPLTTIVSITADLSDLGIADPQALAPGTDGRWSWTGTVTAAASGYAWIEVTGLDDQGGQAESGADIEIEPCIVFEDVRIEGECLPGQAGQLAISCALSSCLGTVVSVAADLSELGIAEPQPLVLGTDGRWSWTGSVTPPAVDWYGITLTATDDGGRSDTYQDGLYVDNGIHIQDMRADGFLQVGIPGPLSVSCEVTNPLGLTVSVAASLSHLGVYGSQPLVLGTDGRWSWTGTVTPSQQDCYVSVTVSDAGGFIDSRGVSLRAEDPFRFSDSYYNGAPRVGAARELGIHCSVVNTASTVTSVVADLSSLGIVDPQPLQQADGTNWTWTGTVTAPAAGRQPVVLTATDASGATRTTTIYVRVDDIISLYAWSDAHLHVGRASDVTFGCHAESLAGEVTSVTADLGDLGLSDSQPLTYDPTQGNWKWTTTFTPASLGYFSFTVTATDAEGNVCTSEPYGMSIYGQCHVDQVSVSPELVGGHACTVTVTCTVTPLPLPAQEVTADLGDIGGPWNAPLTYDGTQWTWTGEVTPPNTGWAWIYVHAMDTEGGNEWVYQGVEIISPVSIADVQVEGSPVVSVASEITVSCTAATLYGAVTSVTADLSELGGSLAQALTLGTDGRYTWTGTVTAPSAGWKNVRVVAADDYGNSANSYGGLWVEDLIRIYGMGLGGDLRVGVTSQVTLSCMTDDPYGTVTSVMADLSGLGIAEPQAMQSSGDGYWTWTGTVTPAAHGSVTIPLTATDDGGLTSTANPSWMVRGRVRIDRAQLSGLLEKDVTSTVTLSCFVTELGDTARAVTTNLSGIGGPADAALAYDGVAWTWTGQVTPVQGGYGDPQVTATDSQGGQDWAWVFAYVQDQVVITDAALTGSLQVNQDCQVRASCNVAGKAAAVQWVYLELYPLGGDYVGAAPGEDGSFSLDVTVHPTQAGDFPVYFHAYDVDGNYTTVQVWVRVAGPVPGDIDGNGVVDVIDLLWLIDAFGAVTGDARYNPACDFNSDQAVDVLDLLDLIGWWPKA